MRGAVHLNKALSPPRKCSSPRSPTKQADRPTVAGGRRPEGPEAYLGEPHGAGTRLGSCSTHTPGSLQKGPSPLGWQLLVWPHPQCAVCHEHAGHLPVAVSHSQDFSRRSRSSPDLMTKIWQPQCPREADRSVHQAFFLLSNQLQSGATVTVGAGRGHCQDNTHWSLSPVSCRGGGGQTPLLKLAPQS